MRKGYLVCYDIRDRRRLVHVCRYLKGRGLHLQYSVFFCSLTWEELQKVKARLRGMINEREDDVRIYPLPSSPEVVALGRGARIPEGAHLFLEGVEGRGPWRGGDPD